MVGRAWGAALRSPLGVWEQAGIAQTISSSDLWDSGLSDPSAVQLPPLEACSAQLFSL